MLINEEQKQLNANDIFSDASGGGASAMSSQLGGRAVNAKGMETGEVKMTFRLSDVKNATTHNVLYVPKLAGNLLSVGVAVKKGNKTTYRKSCSYIGGKDGTLRASSSVSWMLKESPDCHSTSDANSLWHQRLLKKVPG